jgi:putative SOS response-associated peptidase YedK
MPAFLTENTREEWINDRLSLTERMKCIEPVANDFLDAVEIEKVGVL